MATEERIARVERKLDTASRAMNEVINTICEDGSDSPRLRTVTADWHAAAVQLLDRMRRPEQTAS